MKYAKFVMGQNLLKMYTKIINLYNTLYDRNLQRFYSS